MINFDEYKTNEILLINPPIIFKEGYRRPSISIPLGFLYVATSLTKYSDKKIILRDYIGHESVTIDDTKNTANLSQKEYFIGLSYKEIRNDLESIVIPKVVGISCSFLSHSVDTVQELVNIIKELAPDSKIVLGGCGLIKTIHTFFKGIDLFFFGEGEERFPKLLNGEDIFGVKDKDGNAFSEEKAPLYLKDAILDKHAVLDYSLIDINKYIYINEQGAHSRFSKTPKSVSFITTRGCPFKCCYCMIHTVHGRNWRVYSAESIFKNLESLKNDYGIEHIHIEDDQFALKVSRFVEIIKKIDTLGMTWDPSNGLYTQHLKEEDIQLMAKHGAKAIKIAPETGSQRVIDEIIKGKPITVEQMKNVAKWSYNAGLFITGFLIIGFPQETEEDIKLTIDFAKELTEKYKVRWTVSLARPFPGTEIREYCEEHDMLDNTNEIEMLGAANLYNIKHKIFTLKYLQSIVDEIESDEWVQN
jgi:anaerobic magnesium-protoporphyrin IX monomethyl ester cyclase